MGLHLSQILFIDQLRGACNSPCLWTAELQGHHIQVEMTKTLRLSASVRQHTLLLYSACSNLEGENPVVSLYYLQRK